MSKVTELETYGRLTVGQTVTGPGPRPSAPREQGTLIALALHERARSRGYFATVTTATGRTYTTAVGLVSPV